MQNRKIRAFGLIALALTAVIVAVIIYGGRIAPEENISKGSSPAPKIAAKVTPAPAKDVPAAPTPDTSAVAMVTPAAPEQTPAAPMELPAELTGKETPVWGITLPVEAGSDYKYMIALDGRQFPDPLNKGARAIGSAESLFSVPPKPNQTIPRLQGKHGQFFYEGQVKNHLWLIGEWRGMWWSMDEFQPLNDAARKNLEEIKADKSLSSLRGVVIDKQRKPIPRARVRVMGGGHLAVTETDNYGQFRVDRLPLQQIQVGARAWGFRETPRGISAAILPGDKSEPVELVLEPAAVVTGTVRDETGKPLARAAVTASQAMRPAYFSANFTPPSTVYSDASGRYSNPYVVPGTTNFTANHPAYVMAQKPNVDVRADGKPLQLDFVLAKGIALTGRVVQRIAGQEQGVADAAVMIWGSTQGTNNANPFSLGGFGASVQLQATTAADGSFVISNAPDGAVLMQATATKGALRKHEEVSIPIKQGVEPEPVILYLPAEGRVFGRVMDPEKKPIAGATVTLYESSGPQGENFRSNSWGSEDRVPKAVSDTEGKFSIGGFSGEGVHAFSAKADGFAPTVTERIPANSQEEVEITLKRGGAISGHVVEVDTKKPMPSVKLRVTGNELTQLLAEVETKADGTFEFANVPEGDWGVHCQGQYVTPEGVQMAIKAASGIKVRESERTENVEVLAYPAAQISGTVLAQDTKQPVPQAMVQLVSGGQKTGFGGVNDPMGAQMIMMGRMPFGMPGISNTQSGTQGQFSLTNLMPGTYRVTAQKQGFMGGENGSDIVVEKGQQIKGITVLIGQGGSISGVVLDAADKPVSQTQVQVVPESRRGPDMFSSGFGMMGGMGVQTTDADGRFTFSGLPFGQGKLRAVTGMYGQPQGASDYVELTAQKPTAEVVIRVKTGGSISGLIQDKEGKPVAAASIYLEPREQQSGGGFGFGYSARSDAQGGYKVINVPAGSYNVVAQAAKFAQKKAENIALTEGQSLDGIDIVLDPAKTMTGILVDLNTKKMAGWRITAQRVAGNRTDYGGNCTTDSEGRFKLDKLTDGDQCWLQIYADERGIGGSRGGYYSCSFRTGKFAFSEQEQVIVVPVGGKIIGRILYEGTNQPAKDVQIGLDVKHSGQRSEPQGTQCVLDHISMNSVSSLVKPDGTFEIPDLAVSTYRLNIRSDATTMKEVDNVTVDTSLVTDLKDIYLSKGCAVTGVFANYREEPPMPGFWGYSGPRGLEQRVKKNSGEVVQGTSTDFSNSDGKFKITGLPTDAGILLLRLNDYLPVRLSLSGLSPAKPVELGSIALRPGETASGKLLGPGGEPARNANINVQFQFENESFGAHGRTNESGEFTLKGLAPGPATLSAYVGSYEGNPWIDPKRGSVQLQNQKITVNPGGTKNLEFRFAVPTPTPTAPQQP